MSNLLDKASIVTTPTAYDNGKILSVKPAPSLGSEKIVNGDFATDSDWTKQTSWSISGGAANYDFLSDAKYIRQTLLSGGFVAGKVYKINFDITSGTAYMNVSSNGGGLISLNTYSVGSYSIQVTASASGSDLLIYGRNTSGTAFSIDNVSVKEVIDGDFDFTRNSSATRVNSQGLIEDVQILSSNLVSNGDFSQEGSELITNGDFATDSDWNLRSSWVISNGNCSLTPPNSDYLSQASVLTLNKSYKLTFDVVVNSGNLQPQFFDGGFQTIGTYNTTQTVEVYFKPTSSGTLYFKPNLFDGSIDNVSVKEVGQDWTLGTGWSIEDDKATIDNTVNANLDQSITGLSGKKVKVSFEVSDLQVGGSITVGDIVTPSAYTATSNGVQTFNYTATNSTLRVRGKGYPCSISNISVVEITDDTNLPRIDYTGGEGHWLFEPQSTNLFLNSEPTTNEGTSGNITYESFNWALGFSNCVRYGDNSALRFRYGGTVSASTKYTLSAFVIMDDLSEPITGGQTSGDDFTFVLGGSVFSNANSSVSMGNNIWRVSITATTSASPNAVNNGLIKFTTQSSKGFRVVSYQLEQQSFATSYIPTNGSTVTRLQDAAFGAGSSDLINSTEGVLYAETKVSVHGGSITLSDGSNNNNLIISFNLSSGRIDCNMKAGGAYQFIFNYTTDMSINNKIAVRYKANDFALFVNGIKVLTDTTGITPAINALNKINFSSANTASNHLYGKTKCLAVWKEALTDAELTCLTTI